MVAICARAGSQEAADDRVAELEESLHTAVPDEVQQHATRGDALAVDLVDAAVGRTEAGHRVGRKAVVQLFLVVDV